MNYLFASMIFFFLFTSTYAEDYFKFSYDKNGSIEVYKGDQKIHLPEEDDFLEESKGKIVYLDSDKIPEVHLIFPELGGNNGALHVFLKYVPELKFLKEIKYKHSLFNPKFTGDKLQVSRSNEGTWYEELLKYDPLALKFETIYSDNMDYSETGYLRFDGITHYLVTKEKDISLRTHVKSLISIKAFLYRKFDEKTKMYLIKGDKVTLLDEKSDDSGQKWYFINYKGAKDLNMWIKAEAVEIPESEDTSNHEEAIPKAQSKAPQKPITPNNVIEISEEKTPTPITAVSIEKVSIEKPVIPQNLQKESAGGSMPLSLLASLLGLFAFRLS